jgi:thymidine kinase
MFSSKTSRLIEIYNKCNFCNIPVVVINHSIDNRYDDELLSSHDKLKIPCIRTDNLKNTWEKSNYIDKNGNKLNIKNESNVILINEGQFFHDLYEVVVDMLKYNKLVYVCGLDGDFERNKFGPILDLIPICDTVSKLTALCSLCKNGTPGIFSMRLTNETSQTLVGSDNYIPVCRSCYKPSRI